MSIKKVIAQLEKHITFKFPEFDAKFYSNSRNSYVHLGLDKALFSFENYRKLLEEMNSFLNEHLISKQFTCVFPPKLVISTKWKHDYIVYRKS